MGRGSELVALDEQRDGLLRAVSHAHEAVAVEAAVVGIVEKIGKLDRRRSSWPTSSCCSSSSNLIFDAPRRCWGRKVAAQQLASEFVLLYP
jgi:hypothetical protein